jgi:hypothetical protein
MISLYKLTIKSEKKAAKIMLPNKFSIVLINTIKVEKKLNTITSIKPNANFLKVKSATCSF